jgi:zinc protease
VVALARKHFGSLAREEIIGPKPRSEPPQRGERRLVVKAPAQEPYVLMGYKATAVSHASEDWEPYALEMLAEVLDGGSSARLSKRLVRGEEVAASAGAGYSAFTRLPGMLLLEGTPAKGRTPAELEQALRAEVANLRDQSVEPEELERVRAQVIASKVYERDSVFAQAMQIGLLETIGLDWRLADAYVERLQAITAEQVQAVARKYLTDDSLTVARLDPQPLDEGAKKRTAAVGGRHDVR